MDRETQIRQARVLQNNELWGIILNDLRSATTQAWLNANDTAKRERCWLTIRTLEAVRNHVQTTIAELVRE